MPNKLQAYAEQAERTARQITGSHLAWTAFLTTAARLYKYPYNEQLMIYMQRPEATACAEYDFWNEKMGRYVRRGSTGIALIDATGYKPRLKYVFDVSDTGGKENARRVNLWELKDAHTDSVSAMLERNYGVSGKNGLAEQFESVASLLAAEYWRDHSRDILGIVADSYLEEYDDYNIEVAFKNAAAVSITYSLMSRCGMQPEDHFEHEDFFSIFDFNTPRTVAALGTAVSEINEQVLRQIEVTIRNYEREHSAERTAEHGEQPDLHDERRLPDSRPEDRGAGAAPRQVRADAPEVPEGASAHPLEPDDLGGNPVPAPAGDRAGSAEPSGADDAGAGIGGGSDGGAESPRPNEMGGPDEHLQGAGGGSDSRGADLRITEHPARGGQLSFFPTEAEQITAIEEAESAQAPFAFSVSQAQLDHVLRLGGNEDDTRMVIAAAFQKQKSTEDIAALLQNTFHGGNGFKTPEGELSAWYAVDGIHIAPGRSAEYVRTAQVIAWQDAAVRISQLMDSGAYASNVELAEAGQHERMQLAQALWYLKHDLSDEAREQGYLSCMDALRGGGFPDETERLAERLTDSSFRDTLSGEFAQFYAAHEQDRSLLRFHYHKLENIWQSLRDLSLPRREYSSEMAAVPELARFITEDEIDHALDRGSGVEGGKGRIYEYFTADHTGKEKAAFLKDEYGIGGRSHAVSGASHSGENHDSRGITLKKADCANVELSWTKVAARIDSLIQKDRFLSPREKERYAQLQREKEAERELPTQAQTDYNAIKEAHPDDIVLFQVGDFFEMYGEDAKQAAELLDLNLTTRAIPGAGRVEMCGVPSHNLEMYVEKLRDKYDVTIAEAPDFRGERRVYTMRSVDHEAEAAIDAYEAEFGADGTRVFRDPAAEQPQPTVAELFEQYKLTVGNALVADDAFLNACRNSDRENAYLEGAAAIRRIVMASEDLQLTRLYFDMPAFHNRLHQELLDELYPTLATTVTSSPYKVTQADIDAALQSWNGRIESKHAVVRYMKAHARDRDTAAWLAREYGLKDTSKPLQISVGNSEPVTLSWAKVQRRIAQLIQSDSFYTEQEQDNFDNIDPIAIREALAERGIVNGQVVDAEANRNSPFVRQVMADVEQIAAQEAQAAHMDSPDRFSIRLHPNEGGITGIWDSALDRFYEEGRQVLRFAEQSNAIDYLSSIQRSRGMEPDAPVFTTPLGNAYRVGDGFSSTAAEQRETLMVVERVDEDNVWYTLPSVPEQETVSVDRTVFERYLDTGYFFAAEQTQPVKEITAENEQENMIFRVPYAVGDTVYLDNTPFEITEVGALNVQLRDPALRYPVFRAESCENFERLLRRDERNAAITDYLPARSRNDDLRDLLMNGILTPDIRDEVRELFRQGEGNAAIGAYLSNVFAASDADTMTLEDGTEADFITSRSGFQAQVHGEKGVHALGLLWPDAAPVLRAVFLEETQAQSRTQAQAEQSISVQEPEVSQPEQTPPEAAKPEQPQFTTETVAVYPGDKNNLPYDVEIRTLRFDEPEHDPPAPLPPAENFRIMDDDLGKGGAKEKFWRNIKAIATLKQIEAEGRNATPEEQHILSQYVGWGGLADAFDPEKAGWRVEYDELKNALSPEEYAAARASTLNAHYTSPTVIRAIYDAVENMGFQTGNILEPSMGVGNFFGMLPESMKDSQLTGVELDSISGRIARKLYPNADIKITGYENTKFADNFFDLAVGNVPFGDYSLHDKRYDKDHLLIHDYFFVKTLDKVRPGGIVAFVTSKGTLDKANPAARRLMAERADLLGAIRLPNTAFKANAGASVTTDILFLQKKRDTPPEQLPAWTETGKNADGMELNNYFLQHPEMILGTMQEVTTQYGKDTACVPDPNVELEDLLSAAVLHLGHENVFQSNTLIEDDVFQSNTQEPPAPETADVFQSNTSMEELRPFSYAVQDGKLMFKEADGNLVPSEMNATAVKRAISMIGIRDAVRNLIEAQRDGCDDEQLHALQADLTQNYDTFVKEFGNIHKRGNKLAFRKDAGYPLLLALEKLDDEQNVIGKTAIFSKRTISPHIVATHADTPEDALGLSLAERGKIDLAYMSALLDGMPQEQITTALRQQIFLNPQTQEWQPADEYLSGNVRAKLDIARLAAQSDPDFAVNVQMLERVQPEPLTAADINVKLGTTWIPPEDINRFIRDVLHPPFYTLDKIKTSYSDAAKLWYVSNKSVDKDPHSLAYTKYGTSRVNAYELLELSLNLRDVQVSDVKIIDGKEKRIPNTKETIKARNAQDALRQAFKDWVFDDPARRERLVGYYNEHFNTTRPREFDGSHLTLPGINPSIQLYSHQKNAVARILYGGNALLAHCVGAGKTWTMAAAAMELRRLGLSHKPMFVVPNSLTEQWGTEFQQLYPGANILVATEADFTKENRKAFCARIATGDYDAVIIGHTQFEKIPLSPENERRHIERQLDALELSLTDAKRNKDLNFTVKRLESSKKKLETRLEKLMDAKEKDDVVTFEELGVDRLFVDEADEFKNLALFTKMRNVGGISTSAAQKSEDMLAKCEYLNEKTDYHGVCFATGTPVSNSMTELYTMMRYLQNDTLESVNMTDFDSWASNFGETVTAMELAPEGTGYRTKTRFAKFCNLPELINLWRQAADIQTADMLDLQRPEVEYHNVKAQPTAAQQAMVQELGKRADRVRSGAVAPYEDNMLAITNDGRKLALDQRLADSSLPDDPGSKLNMVVENVFNTWESSKPTKGTQLIFCDLATPSAVGKDSGRFCSYDDIRDKLIAKGVPADQIAYIHDADTPAKKNALSSKMKSGAIRVLIGSTAKMGAGFNVQERLVALHHVDCPWRPRDVEQRDGRILRQGNTNEKVHIYRYVTEGTFDSYNWQTVENKQKFISQVVTGKSPARTCDDIDDAALSYAEVKALAAGDPEIKERMELDVDVQKLSVLRTAYHNDQYKLEDDVNVNLPHSIVKKENMIAALKRDQATLDANHAQAEGDTFCIELNGKTYNAKDKAGEALLSMVAAERKKISQNMDGKLTYEDARPIGSYCGFALELKRSLMDEVRICIHGDTKRMVELGDSATGCIQRINNAMNDIGKFITDNEQSLVRLHEQLDEAKVNLGKPWPLEDEYQQKISRLNELNYKLTRHHSSENSPEHSPAQSELEL